MIFIDVIDMRINTRNAPHKSQMIAAIEEIKSKKKREKNPTRSAQRNNNKKGRFMAKNSDFYEMWALDKVHHLSEYQFVVLAATKSICIYRYFIYQALECVNAQC